MWLRSTILLASVLVGALAIGQTMQTKTNPTAKSASKPYGTLNFKSSVGSFKILGGGDDPAEGRLEISFAGTVLVSGLQGSITPVGNVRRELNYVEQHKQVYFGKGKLVVDGKYGAIQFFGRDLVGKFNGYGIMRLYGEFDKNLQTGDYWYDGREKRPWNTGGMTVAIPEPNSFQTGTSIKMKMVPGMGVAPSGKVVAGPPGMMPPGE